MNILQNNSGFEAVIFYSIFSPGGTEKALFILNFSFLIAAFLKKNTE